MVMETTGETPNLDVALVRSPLFLPLVLLIEIWEGIGAAASISGGGLTPNIALSKSEVEPGPTMAATSAVVAFLLGTFFQ